MKRIEHTSTNAAPDGWGRCRTGWWLVVLVMAIAGEGVSASSHREAPALVRNPALDLTDLNFFPTRTTTMW